MKKDICEFTGCRKTATVKLRNNHKICEDCAKELRRMKKAGKKPYCFFKEVLVGHIGNPKNHFNFYKDIPIKL